MEHFQLTSKINPTFTAYLQIFIYVFRQYIESIYAPHYCMLVQTNWQTVRRHFPRGECETLMEVKELGKLQNYDFYHLLMTS